MDHQGMLIILVAGYFLPAIVANSRRHRQQLAIFALTLFAGWTAIGWIVAIVWACTDNVRERPQRSGFFNIKNW
jgi:threonine/homoserine/homoserine lactone efflux protein